MCLRLKRNSTCQTFLGITISIFFLKLLWWVNVTPLVGVTLSQNRISVVTQSDTLSGVTLSHRVCFKKYLTIKLIVNDYISAIKDQHGEVFMISICFSIQELDTILVQKFSLVEEFSLELLVWGKKFGLLKQAISNSCNFWLGN